MSLYFCFIDGTAYILQIVSHVLNFLGVKELSLPLVARS